MAITTQVLSNGDRNLVIKLHINNTADYTDQLIVDASTYGASEVRIVRCTASFIGFSAKLIWDATTNVDIMALPEGEDIYDFELFGGLPNNSGAGKTGDILMTTYGLAAGDEGTIVLEMKKQ